MRPKRRDPKDRPKPGRPKPGPKSQPVSELLTLGLSHKTAPLELRERLALPEGRAAGLMNELTGNGDAAEATIVS
ncbi:MAG: hypothetical protein KDB64_03875, partial [Solirubrobacterales bacterium]|nr:hypothetical protein [Solirubrobacterales bacterium]